MKFRFYYISKFNISSIFKDFLCFSNNLRVSISHYGLFKNNGFVFFDKGAYFGFRNFFNRVVSIPVVYIVRLFLKGVGYKILRGRRKNYNSVYRFELGFSVVRYFFFPKVVYLKHRKDRIMIFSYSKDAVVRYSRLISSLRVPDVYKGKGVRDGAYVFQPKPGKQRLLKMPVNIGKSQILFDSRRGSFIFVFSTVFGIGKSVSKWTLSNLGLSVAATYADIYVNGPISREQTINRLFFKYRHLHYFIFGRQLKHLRFLRKKYFFFSTQIRSLRMQAGLPIWHQRTRSNAKTAKRLNRRNISSAS